MMKQEESVVKCKKNGCSNFVSKSGYCAYHYSQVMQCEDKGKDKKLNDKKEGMILS